MCSDPEACRQRSVSAPCPNEWTEGTRSMKRFCHLAFACVLVISAPMATHAGIVVTIEAPGQQAASSSITNQQVQTFNTLSAASYSSPLATTVGTGIHNFFGTSGTTFNKIVFLNGNSSGFESDNHTFSVDQQVIPPILFLVPEPTTLTSAVLGILAAGFWLRRQSNAVKV